MIPEIVKSISHPVYPIQCLHINIDCSRYENWLRNYKRQPNEKVLPWSYDQADTGPDMWGSLKKAYQLCDP